MRSLSRIHTAQTRFFSRTGLLSLLLLAMPSLHAASIGAIGHLDPAGGVHTIGGPGGETVTEVLVAEGDPVAKGAMLVRFSGEAGARANFKAAQLAVREADIGGEHTIKLARLAEEVAGEAHRAAMVRLNRYLRLEPSSISSQETEIRETQVKAAEMELMIARQTRAQAEFAREMAMANAKNQLVQARLQLERSLATSPIAGTVIQCSVVPGASARGALVQVADLSEMIVKAEVFEGDLLKIKVGAKAKVTSSSLPESLTAAVVSIGRQVSGQSKVAEVRLRLDQAELAAQFIGMEVNVAIEQ